MRPTIIIAEDEKYIGKYFQKKLEDKGYSTTLVQNSQDFDKHLKEKHYDIILSDTKIPNTPGYEIVKNNLENQIDTIIIGMSSNTRFKEKWSNIAHEFLDKYSNIENITETLTQIYKKYRKE